MPRPALNIQYPITDLIRSKQKTVETRNYPLPLHYIRQPLYLVETPGPARHFRARVIGLITFDASFLYPSMDKFYQDFARHRVSSRSPWRWQEPKWGWPIAKFQEFSEVIPLGDEKRGIVFTRSLMLPRGEPEALHP